MHFGEVIKGVCVLFGSRSCEVMSSVRRDFCGDEEEKDKEGRSVYPYIFESRCYSASLALDSICLSL